jgi:hypothetical protein
MNVEETILITVLIASNIAAAIAGAVLLGRMLGRLRVRPQRWRRYAIALVGVYFVECVAFAIGMCTQVFTVALAFVWGIVFGLWLRGRAERTKVAKASVWVALYTVLPTASLCLAVPSAFVAGGQSLFSGRQAAEFGIPDFLPWPVNTVAGFFGVLLLGTLVLKLGIMLAEVLMLNRVAVK